jgi:CheY-like chemotaxis protein
VAVDLYAARWRDLDVVVLDVMMPDVDGREVLRRMREVNPDVRAILSSGHAVESDPSLSIAGTWLLEKPYTPDQVRIAISDATKGATGG